MDSDNDLHAVNDAAQETIRCSYDLVEQYFCLHPDIRRFYLR